MLDCVVGAKLGNFLVTACVPLLPFPDRFELHQRICHMRHPPRRHHSPLTSQPQAVAEVTVFLGPEVHHVGPRSVSWDCREMTWSSKMGNITPAPRVVTGLQRASFTLYLSDLGLGTNSVLTTQGERLNHTLVSSRVCGMWEVF